MRYSLDHVDDDPRIVEFVSLQDLKGSQYFGGAYDKLKHIAEFDWDLLVIDEAHEGIDTTKTDVAFDQIKRKWTLHLSGTPFKALASGKFGEDQIFNWTYEDEQAAREQWADGGQENPYAALPTLNLLTYQLSRMITDRLAEGVAIDEDEANIDYTFDLNEFFAHQGQRLLRVRGRGHQVPRLPDDQREVPVLHSRTARRDPALLLAAQPCRLRQGPRTAAEEARGLQGLHGHPGRRRRALDERRARRGCDDAAVGKSLDKVRDGHRRGRGVGGKTITLSVGQLTTGVTVPEWTAVIMLSNLSSPALYMQAAFRAQNPCTFERGGSTCSRSRTPTSSTSHPSAR